MSGTGNVAAKSPHYEGMVVHLRRDGAREWALYTVLEGQVTSFATLIADEETAISRAEGLAGWFGAELVISRVGAAKEGAK